MTHQSNNKSQDNITEGLEQLPFASRVQQGRQGPTGRNSDTHSRAAIRGGIHTLGDDTLEAGDEFPRVGVRLLLTLGSLSLILRHHVWATCLFFNLCHYLPSNKECMDPGHLSKENETTNLNRSIHAPSSLQHYLQ